MAKSTNLELAKDLLELLEHENLKALPKSIGLIRLAEYSGEW